MFSSHHQCSDKRKQCIHSSCCCHRRCNITQCKWSCCCCLYDVLCVCVCVCVSMLNCGGWTVLHNWLLHCKAHDFRTFLVELLKLYKQLPVTVELLRQNSCAKDIKQLSRCPDTSKSVQSSQLLSLFCDAWVVIILYCFVLLWGLAALGPCCRLPAASPGGG